MSKRYKAKRRERYRRRFCESGPFEMQDTGPCWCGEREPYYAPLPHYCGGSGDDCHPDEEDYYGPEYDATDFDPMHLEYP